MLCQLGGVCSWHRVPTPWAGTPLHGCSGRNLGRLGGEQPSEALASCALCSASARRGLASTALPSSCAVGFPDQQLVSLSPSQGHTSAGAGSPEARPPDRRPIAEGREGLGKHGRQGIVMQMTA